MSDQLIALGEGVAKDCFPGDRRMNRYGVFNGLARVMRIDSNYTWTVMGVRKASTPTAAVEGVGGAMAAGWYAYVAVYASNTYKRLVPVLDGSGNMTRGNPSDPISIQVLVGNASVAVTVPGIAQAGITHILLYRSSMAGTEAAALAGPFFYAAQGANDLTGANVTITDTIADATLGFQVEENNFAPKAYRYAIAADSFVFAGGNFMLGKYCTCTVTPGSSYVTVDNNPPLFYDGIDGWTFKVLLDASGGTNSGGLYYCRYVNEYTLELLDASGAPTVYTGALSGSGHEFRCYLSGFLLQWSKQAEPEAWPTENAIQFEGNITGIAQIPNQPLIVVCTDEPSMRVFDLRLIGTDTFKTRKTMISNEFSVSSHYSLKSVGGVLRGIDASRKAIIETDGTGVRDVSSAKIPFIWDKLSLDVDFIRNWHCAYDPNRHLFGAFVTLKSSHRIVDFALIQHVLTGGWTFNLEKDLLSTGRYIDPDTDEQMVLGGTQGISTDAGGVWGRIWAPNVWDDWIPENSLRNGEIVSATETGFTVDTSLGTFFTSGSKLIGRWALVCNARDEYPQLVYIRDNTEDTIVVSSVLGGLDPLNLSPVPVAGWKFYLGMIEMRWGPKRFDLGTPDLLKRVWELWACIHAHDESNPPFVRIYRGYETGYDNQVVLNEMQNMDQSTNQSLVTGKVNHLLEPVPRWGVALHDRSYGPTTLTSLTLVFNELGGPRERS